MVINYSHINKTNTCHLQSLRIEIQVLACSGMCGGIKPINEIPTLRDKWIPTPMDSNSLVINGF